MTTELKRFMSTPALQRFRPIYQLGVAYVVAGILLRLGLWWQFGRASDVAVGNLLWIVPAGVFNDVIQCLYLSLPLALYILLVPDRWYRTRASRILLGGAFIATIAGLVFLCTAEYFFFEEFDARFNLVAFDYLMYPTEVIGDIRSEYPLPWVVGIAVATGALGFLLLRKPVLGSTRMPAKFARRMRPAAALFFAAMLGALLIDTDTLGWSSNRVANELAANGASSFVRAARTSELLYPAYYATRDSRQNFAVLTDFLAHRGGKLTQLRQGKLNRQFAADPKGLGKLNVVVIAEEAFGAEFSKLYGSEQDLTPHFDSYAKQAMWFRHMYASGTRTVRGLEAIAASFPPIPSESILRRPKNERIATWGSVMQKQGYDSSFIYGGYGYFDNMNYFFGNNGFNVVDRTQIDKVRYENIWGVSDEDLFDRALQYFDDRGASGQPFFSILMTTSNHKPFTFREGVPGVPATGGGRAAGVRYADFALGYFLEEAKKHSWFDNTIFVVVADHGARVYGKADIPLRTYEIPMMVYAPKHVSPRMIETLTSQIDVAPTVLGLLGLEYEAPFFGSNVLACDLCERIALFSHNHDVAVYRDGKLEVLGLGKTEHTLTYNRTEDRYTSVAPDRKLSDLAVAIYQTAYEQFQARKYE